MIFVSTGTSKYPFPRLVRAVDELAPTLDEDVFVQAGSTLTEYTPRHVEYAEYVSREEYERRVATCDLFVTHGGTGSIITALRHGTPTVIFPREGDRGEHTDDMMSEITAGWSDRAAITVARDPDALAAALRSDEREPPGYGGTDRQLHDAVEAAIADLAGLPEDSTAAGTSGGEGDVRRPVVFCPTPPGGHFTQLRELVGGFDRFDVRYLTWDAAIAGDLEGVELVTGYHTESLPAPGTAWRLLKTSLQALRLVVRERPAVVLSLGGGAFPISVAVLGTLAGAGVIHVESLTRFDSASTTGRLLYPFADRFFVQHPDVLAAYGDKAKYSGRVF